MSTRKPAPAKDKPTRVTADEIADAFVGAFNNPAVDEHRAGRETPAPSRKTPARKKR